MKINFWYSISIIIAVGLTTYFIRLFPFLILSKKNKTIEDFMMYLGKVLPPAVIGILIIYCLKDINFSATPYGAPEFLAVIMVVLLHIWKRQTLMSILGGTIFYMILLQKIFV